MAAGADAYASDAVVGWIEEVHKGLEGLRRLEAGEAGAVGRQLNARFGCSFGLTHGVYVQRGVLLESDNASFEQVAAALGSGTRWSRLQRTAFGVRSPREHPVGLREQVEAGLALSAETARLLSDSLSAERTPLVRRTGERIEAHLPHGRTIEPP